MLFVANFKLFLRPHYTNCIYFLVGLKNKYAMVNADITKYSSIKLDNIENVIGIRTLFCVYLEILILKKRVDKK